MEACHSMIKEWYATRMILEWYLGEELADDLPADQVKKIQEMKAGSGGLKLALQRLTNENWENCHLQLICNRPL